MEVEYGVKGQGGQVRGRSGVRGRGEVGSRGS